MTQPFEPVCCFRSLSIAAVCSPARRRLAIAREAVLEIVVTNEGECVPRFDFCQQSRVYFRMTREVVVESGGEGVAQRTHMRVETRVFLAGQPRNLECVVESIFIESLLAVNFRSAAEGEDKVFLDAPEVVFGLSVGKAEHGAGVGAAKDVRDAVSVAIDRHAPREWIRLRGKKNCEHHECDNYESESFEHMDHH